MPTDARAVKREHVESYIAARRDQVKPSSLSVEFRALQQFWKWALEEEEIERSPMERMRVPRVPDAPVPVVSVADFRRMLRTTDGRSVTGLLVKRDTGEVVLRDAQNNAVRVPATDVEALTPARDSLMPAGALADLTPQEAADLLAYLASRK